MNAFLRNIERIRDMEREERITTTRAVELEKQVGRRKGGLTEEQLRERYRDRMRATRAAKSGRPVLTLLPTLPPVAHVRAAVLRAHIYAACEAGDMATAQGLIARVYPSEVPGIRYRVVRWGWEWPR
jgi:hypothetical protein